MGEYQNKAVTLMTACHGETFLTDPRKRSEAYLAAAIDLFQALGGTAEELAAAVEAAGERPAPAVDAAIGDLMKELAAIGSLHDLDIMQAAYNTLDERLKTIRSTLKTARKVR